MTDNIKAAVSKEQFRILQEIYRDANDGYIDEHDEDILFITLNGADLVAIKAFIAMVEPVIAGQSVIVPVEPTEAMTEAIFDTLMTKGEKSMKDVYRAMLAAREK